MIVYDRRKPAFHIFGCFQPKIASIVLAGIHSIQRNSVMTFILLRSPTILRQMDNIREENPLLSMNNLSDHLTLFAFHFILIDSMRIGTFKTDTT
jgi:hypothetical protein